MQGKHPTHYEITPVPAPQILISYLAYVGMARWPYLHIVVPTLTTTEELNNYNRNPRLEEPEILILELCINVC